MRRPHRWEGVAAKRISQISSDSEALRPNIRSPSPLCVSQLPSGINGAHVRVQASDRGLGKRPPDATFPGGQLAAGPKRIRRARFGADNEGVRSHGAQLPVLSSKRTLAQLKIQDWGRAVALKDTAAAATEKRVITSTSSSSPSASSSSPAAPAADPDQDVVAATKCETDLRQDQTMRLRSVQRSNKVGRINN